MVVFILIPLQPEVQMPFLKEAFSNQPNFNILGLGLPVLSAQSLPYFPNYRLYDFANSPCDTFGINAPVSIEELDKQSIFKYQLLPNPAGEQVILQSLSTFNNPKAKVWIYDMLGQIKLESETSNQSSEIKVEGWPSAAGSK